jgi:hypothetical protein
MPANRKKVFIYAIVTENVAEKADWRFRTQVSGFQAIKFSFLPKSVNE